MDTDSGDWMGMDDEGMYGADRVDDSADSITSVREAVTKAMVLLLVVFVVFFIFAWVMFG